MTKLAIVEDRDEDKYEFKTVLKCWKCEPENGLEIPDAMADPHVKSLSDGVMQSLSSARQSEVKAWEEEITPCEHTLTLQQQSTGPILASGIAHCSHCDLKENLWLCLTCGSLGCGRQQYGGLGGNGHGLQHYEETRHPISVKLGTITPEGNAGISSYSNTIFIKKLTSCRYLLLHMQRCKARSRACGTSSNLRYQRPNSDQDGEVNDRTGACYGIPSS